MGDPAGYRRPARKRPRPLLRTILGNVLRRTRLAQRRTLADVARAARVSVPYLSEIERGRKEASSEVLAAVCEALHIGLPELLAEVSRGLAGAGAGGRLTGAEVSRRLAGAEVSRRLAGAEVSRRLTGDGASRGLAGTAPGAAAGEQTGPAPVIRLDTVRGQRARPQSPPRGDAQCRLAA